MIERECDYCGARFQGPTCPGCGYDFTGVYPDIDAEEAKEMEKTMEAAADLPVAVDSLLKKAYEAGLEVDRGLRSATVRRSGQAQSVATLYWHGPEGTRAYLRVAPGQDLERAHFSHVARRFDEIAEESR